MKQLTINTQSGSTHSLMWYDDVAADDAVEQLREMAFGSQPVGCISLVSDTGSHLHIWSNAVESIQLNCVEEVARAEAIAEENWDDETEQVMVERGSHPGQRKT